MTLVFEDSTGSKRFKSEPFALSIGKLLLVKVSKF